MEGALDPVDLVGLFCNLVISLGNKSKYRSRSVCCPDPFFHYTCGDVGELEGWQGLGGSFADLGVMLPILTGSLLDASYLSDFSLIWCSCFWFWRLCRCSVLISLYVALVGLFWPLPVSATHSWVMVDMVFRFQRGKIDPCLRSFFLLEIDCLATNISTRATDVSPLKTNQVSTDLAAIKMWLSICAHSLLLQVLYHHAKNEENNISLAVWMEKMKCQLNFQSDTTPVFNIAPLFFNSVLFSPLRSQVSLPCVLQLLLNNHGRQGFVWRSSNRGHPKQKNHQMVPMLVGDACPQCSWIGKHRRLLWSP